MPVVSSEKNTYMVHVNEVEGCNEVVQLFTEVRPNWLLRVIAKLIIRKHS